MQTKPTGKISGETSRVTPKTSKEKQTKEEEEEVKSKGDG
jgi:hypothetical protein